MYCIYQPKYYNVMIHSFLLMTRKKIIIADDDSVFAKLLMYEFEHRELDMDVTIAENGGQALSCMTDSQPDLLLLDLRMPITDGFSVLEQVRNSGMTFPIVILTHFRDKHSVDKAMLLGATDFLIKSELSMNQLADRIVGHLKSED
ncbi:MAG: two component transcriptional regulator, winged helix family [Candidatus Peribacteria bacterium]|nr:two component transcriptional regulator, winged helix family [Candidatus Peribacteria bacterium]